MPTVRTVTVKSSGGDYTSLSAAEAGEQADLPALDRQTNIEVYDFTDTTTVDITGWTTDATRYINIYAAVGNGHSGTWDNSKYNLSISAAFGGALAVRENYVRVTGLQFDCTHVTSAGTPVGTVDVIGASDVRFERCIARRTGAQAGNMIVSHTAGTATLRNCIFYQNTDSHAVRGAGGTLIIQNCTITAAAGDGIHNFFDASTITVDNTYSGGHTGAAYAGAMTRTTCAHSSATVFSGSTASIAYSTANFVNVTTGSQNLHLIVGASATLLTGGTDKSGTYTVDIDNQTRTDWSIGADEFVEVVASALIALHHMFKSRMFNTKFIRTKSSN